MISGKERLFLGLVSTARQVQVGQRVLDHLGPEILLKLQLQQGRGSVLDFVCGAVGQVLGLRFLQLFERGLEPAQPAFGPVQVSAQVIQGPTGQEAKGKDACDE